MTIEYSPYDSKRFKIKCARSVGWEHSGKLVLDFCDTHDIDLLIARVNVTDTMGSWSLQKNGAKLVDTLLYFKLDLHATSPVAEKQLPDGFTVRECRKDDEQQLHRLGELAFSGYFSHYHNDPLMAPDKCDAIYAQWCQKFAKCLPEKPAYVLELDDRVAGLAGLYREDDNCVWDAEVFAVSPQTQGNGGFSALLGKSINAARNSGAKFFSYSTQIQNIHVMNALVRRGFVLDKSVNTFHLWFKQQT